MAPHLQTPINCCKCCRVFPYHLRCLFRPSKWMENRPGPMVILAESIISCGSPVILWSTHFLTLHRTSQETLIFTLLYCSILSRPGFITSWRKSRSRTRSRNRGERKSQRKPYSLLECNLLMQLMTWAWFFQLNGYQERGKKVSENRSNLVFFFISKWDALKWHRSCPQNNLKALLENTYDKMTLNYLVSWTK